jgi:hypothetical protein
MRLTTIQLLLIVIFLTTSCARQGLSGNWKLQRVEIMDVPHQKKIFTLDLTRPEKIKADMYKDHQQQALAEGSGIDSTELMTDINKTVSSYLQARLILDDDNQFRATGGGLIIPSAIPGWHFGDSSQGRWTKTNDTLLLFIGDDSQGYTSKFKILKVTGKDLKLQEIFENFEGKGNELFFVRQ